MRRWCRGSGVGGWVVVVAVVSIAASAGCGPSGGGGVGGTGGGAAGRGGAGGSVGSGGSGGSTGGSTPSAGTSGGAGTAGSGGSVGGVGGNAGGGAGSVGTGGNAGTGGGGAGTGGVAGNAGTGGAAGRGGQGGTAGAGVPTNDVDVLFLVDDSSSMRLAQTNLVRSFPAFPIALKAAPQVVPDLHIAIISSDMGAGDGSVASCDATGGKNGIFQYTPRGDCTATGLDTGATFISDIGGVRNYAGRLENVFTCIAALGEGGCGFEQTFASVLRALGADGRAAPAENQGFLRPDAYLAIVIVTNEDDCSATPDVPLYDTGSNTDIASQLGPPANYRCNEFGHLCNGLLPIRAAPGADMSAMVSYDTCTSNDRDGYVLSAVETANRIKALKADPSKVIVAAIAGPALPYTVTWKAPSTADTSCGAASCPWPVIAHSCTAADGSFADPPVRITELTNQFGANGLVRSICSDDLAPALQSVAQAIVGHLSP